MRSNTLFLIGLAINAFTLIVTLSSLFAFRETPGGLSLYGRVMARAIPLALLSIIAVAFWLRSTGRVLAANIVIWAPALPMLTGIVIWGGLAMLFVVFGK